MSLLKRMLLIVFVLSIVYVAYGATVSRFVSGGFSDGDVLTASNLNGELDNLVSNINTLDDANLKNAANIQAKKLKAEIAGDGLSRNVGTGVLSVDVDDSTTEISGNEVIVKDGGVTGAKLDIVTVADALDDEATIEDDGAGLLRIKDSGVTSAKIADNTIVDGDIAANTITAGSIAANAVDTSELNANAVTNAKILDGTVLYEDGETVNYAAGGGTHRIGYEFSGTHLSASLTSIGSTTITTTGKPVAIWLSGANNASPGKMGCTHSGAAPDGLQLCQFEMQFNSSRVSFVELKAMPLANMVTTVPPSMFGTVNIGAGTYTIDILCSASGGAPNCFCNDCTITAEELK